MVTPEGNVPFIVIISGAPVTGTTGFVVMVVMVCPHPLMVINKDKKEIRSCLEIRLFFNVEK